MRLIITYILLFVGCILLLFKSLYENVPSTVSDILLRLYYIGGIVSGVFAFGAFFIAILTYLNQKKTGDLQRFETTLFNMLQLQQQITNELRYEDTEPDRNPNHKNNTNWRTIEKRGRDVFEHFWASKWFCFREIIDGKISLNEKSWYEGMMNVLTSRGSEAYNQLTEITTFDHYFRHLYRIIKFIDNNKVLDDKEKYDYTSIVRATLSRFELVWLYYNCLYGPGKSKFKPLIEKYALLKNLRDEFLTISKDVIEKDYFRKHQMIIDDYLNYLTIDKNDTSRYYIGAFYNSRNKESFLKAIEDFKNSPAAKLDKESQ